MIVSIMQPNYIPWLGYFELIKKTDTFVFYDDVQYTKNDWRNRNKIKLSNGEYCWLTVPVQKDGLQLINQVKIADEPWKEKHLKTLEMNYKQAEYFDEVYEMMENIFKTPHKNLFPLCRDIILEIIDYLGIKVNITNSSEIGHAYLRSTDRLVAICNELEATEYYSPNAAKIYLDKGKFDIPVVYQEYRYKGYTQLHGKFLPYMSILDLLFNHGKESIDKI